MSSETPYPPRHYQPGLADPPGAPGPPGLPDRDEHLQERIVRHGGAERLGHVHVAVLIVGPGPHVAARRVVEIALPFQLVADIVLEHRRVRALQRAVRDVELLALARGVDVD